MVTFSASGKSDPPSGRNPKEPLRQQRICPQKQDQQLPQPSPPRGRGGKGADLHATQNPGPAQNQSRRNSATFRAAPAK
ncbi:hypothetical protein DCO47_19250 [Pseudomonas sp. NDM]|nr:hypothetical protein DCO47_19250 [Pseudomonas sp. NDM]